MRYLIVLSIFLSFNVFAEKIMTVVNDRVHKIVERDNGYRVLFKFHSGMYFLKKDQSNTPKILKMLEDAKVSGETISVEVDALSLEIKK